LVRAEKEYHKPLETEEEIANVYAEEGLGILCLQQGKFEKSIEHIKQAIDWAENVGSAEYKSFFHSCLAYIYTKSGDYQRALEECDEALRAVEAGNLKYQRLALHYKGLAYVEMDSLNEAQKIADGLKGLIDRGLNKKAMRDYYHLIGQIQLKRDKISNAIGYFKEAISLLPYQSQFDFYIVFGHALFFDSLASAYYRADDLEKACEEYENVTSFTTGRLFFGDIYARSLYMLGKIYQEQGKKSKAIEHYEKFLDLWKYADPGIAEVEDARKRLAGLKSQ
jgi:tetratricopeptide (TPR) repeat protein